MTPLCMMIGVFLYCGNSAQPTAQFLQPRREYVPTYIVGNPYGGAASTTRNCDDLLPAYKVICDAGWRTRDELMSEQQAWQRSQKR